MTFPLVNLTEMLVAAKNIAIDLYFTLKSATGEPDHDQICNPWASQSTSRLSSAVQLHALKSVMEHYRNKEGGDASVSLLSERQMFSKNDGKIDIPKAIMPIFDQFGGMMRVVIASSYLEQRAAGWEQILSYVAKKPIHSSTGKIDFFSHLTIGKRTQDKLATKAGSSKEDLDPLTGKVRDNSFPVTSKPLGQSARQYLKDSAPPAAAKTRIIPFPNDPPTEAFDLTGDTDGAEDVVKYVSGDQIDQDASQIEADIYALNRRDWKLAQKLFAEDDSRTGQVRWDELNKVRDSLIP